METADWTWWGNGSGWTVDVTKELENHQTKMIRVVLPWLGDLASSLGEKDGSFCRQCIGFGLG